VVDPGLCHGASGLAHTFNRLFQSTGDGDCLGAARHWLSVAVQMRNDEGLAGYAAWGASGRARWDAERGLLEGIAGIGLALVAAITAENPAWDRCLLLA
jgi:lantibiotic modifying enzyme